MEDLRVDFDLIRSGHVRRTGFGCRVLFMVYCGVSFAVNAWNICRSEREHKYRKVLWRKSRFAMICMTTLEGKYAGARVVMQVISTVMV